MSGKSVLFTGSNRVAAKRVRLGAVMVVCAQLAAFSIAQVHGQQSSTAPVGLVSGLDSQPAGTGLVPTGSRPCRPVDLDAFQKGLYEQVSGKVEAFEQVPTALGLEPRVLVRLIRGDLKELLVLDDERVARHFNFQQPEQTTLRGLLGKWGISGLAPTDYLSIPFFVDTSQGFQIVVSCSLPDAPASTRMYYLTLFKAMACQPKDLRDSASVWACGLGSLIAQETLGSTSLAACPDLEIETALVALLAARNKELVGDLLADRFDRQAYDAMLTEAIRQVGSVDPDAALKDLLRPPEELLVYSEARQAEQKSQVKAVENKDLQEEQEIPLLPPLSPAMRLLYMVLTDDESALEAMLDDVRRNIADRTLRIVLFNACCDKLCAVVAQKHLGFAANSTILARQSLQPDASQEIRELVGHFGEWQKRVWIDFREDLQARGQTGTSVGKQGVAFNPAMLKWTFRFLYNYSLPIRQKEKEYLDSLKQRLAATDDRHAECELAKSLTPDVVREWWQQDPCAKELFALVGEPRLDVHDSPVVVCGKTLECTWTLNRKKIGDREQVRLRIFDSFSSGENGPKPGVSDKAKVVVRKSLKQPPEVVSLGEVRRGFFVQSLSQIETKGPTTAPAEDWARVVRVKAAPVRGAWQLESNGPQPLVLGRIQKVWSKIGKGDIWGWLDAHALAEKDDSLLAINPAGVIPEEQRAAFESAEIVKSRPAEKGCQLVQLSLSHKEIRQVEESGTPVWGFFADARLAMAEVFPAPEGVDGAAMVETPGGKTKRLDQLQAGHGQGGEPVSSFDYGNPQPVADRVVDRPSSQVDFCIEIAYRWRDGRQASIRVAEGQLLLVAEGKEASFKKAYQLKLGSQLVSGFDDNGVVEVVDLKETEVKLGVYSLKVKQCPLVRINGIMIPVLREPIVLASGVSVDSQIQLAPSLNVLALAAQSSVGASAPVVNLQAPAGQLPAGQVTNRSALLSYNALSTPGQFWAGFISGHQDDTNARHMVITTPKASLVCGHLQGVYAAPAGSTELKPVAAEAIQPGWQVAWLNREAPERARIELVSVQSAREGVAEKEIAFREFILPDTRSTRAKEGLCPTAFANGILVELTVVAEEPLPVPCDSPGCRGPGPRPGPNKPEVKGPGFPQPSLTGSMDDLALEEPRVQFSLQDVKAFQDTRDALTKAFGETKLATPASNSAGEQAVLRFLGHYFQQVPQINEVYAGDSLRSYIDDYLQSRDFYVTTGDKRVWPAVANAYVFLGTLLYAGGAEQAGDCLSRDYLCMVLRTLTASDDPQKPCKPGAKSLLAQASCVRAGLLAMRDMLAYLRPRASADGFPAVTGARLLVDDPGL